MLLNFILTKRRGALCNKNSVLSIAIVGGKRKGNSIRRDQEWFLFIDVKLL